MSDYTPLLNAWKEPDGGFKCYLEHFLSSGDGAFQHIATWTVLQLLEADEPDVKALIVESPEIVRAIRQTAEREPQTDDDPEGEGEIVPLARRVVELIDQ